MTKVTSLSRQLISKAVRIKLDNFNEKEKK